MVPAGSTAALGLKATVAVAVLAALILPSLALCPPPGPAPPPPPPPPSMLAPPPAPAPPVLCDTCDAACWSKCAISQRCVELCSLVGEESESCRPCKDDTFYNECQEICKRDCANCVQVQPPQPSSSPPVAQGPPAQPISLEPAPPPPPAPGALALAPTQPIFCDKCLNDCWAMCRISERCSQLCRLGEEACRPCNDGTYNNQCTDTCNRTCADCVLPPPPPPPPSPGSLYRGLSCDECLSNCSSTCRAAIYDKCHENCFADFCDDCRTQLVHCSAELSASQCNDVVRNSCRSACSTSQCEPCKRGYEQSCLESCTRDHDCTGCVE